MTDIFKTVCTSEEEFQYVNMPIFPEGSKAGNQYSQVPAMMLEAMIKAWTKLQASPQNKTRLLRLKGIIVCCNYATEAKEITDDFVYKMRIEPMGSRFQGKVSHIGVAPAASSPAASPRGEAAVVPRGSVATEPVPQAKAMPISASGQESATAGGTGQKGSPSLADFLVEKTPAGKGKAAATPPWQQQRAGKGKSSASSGWSWGKGGKLTWSGSAGKGSKRAGSKGPYTRSTWRSSDWGSSSQSSNWHSWQNQDY